MRIVKDFCIAFSMYSQIPMPQFEWKEEDMKYALCFFPWVGAVIGACVYVWWRFCESLGVGVLCRSLVGAAIPLLVTGGFHADGYMDTCDAFHSYRPREKKLEILKDSHIGAFAVIMLAVYGLLYLGAISEIQSENILGIVCTGFVLARILSGISVVTFSSAKKEGTLWIFADSAKKKFVRMILCAQGIVCVGFMLWQSPWAGAVTGVAALCVFMAYYFRCRKELGGITGDTAGYFVLVCEAWMMTAGAVVDILQRNMPLWTGF